MPADHGPAFALHAAISAVIALAMAILWALTGAGTFWAGWVWIGLAAAVAVHAALRWALPMEPPGVRARGDPRLAVGDPVRHACRGLAAVGRRPLLAADPGAGHGDGDGDPRPRRLPRPAVGRRPRAGADRARRRAHPHAARGGRGPGRRAAADRARPPRRRAGAAGRAQHAARAGRGAARRPPGGGRPGAAGAGRGERRDRRAARPRPRDRPAGARRPRPRGRGRGARRALGGAGQGQLGARPSGRCRWSRPPPTSSSPSR